jgi:signal transduction histidine kinase
LSDELDTLARASRLDQENVRIAKLPVQRLLDGIHDNWNMRARRKGLTLRVIPSGATVESDEKLLGTIIGNLVGNAIKYTETGSVLVGVRRRGDACRIEVWDTGVGIPEAQRGKIFESFNQLDSQSEGLGLGLAIVRRTSELLGARVVVQSRPGRGSCFSVTVYPPVQPGNGAIA